MKKLVSTWIICLLCAPPLMADDIWEAWGKDFAAQLVGAGVASDEARRTLTKITTLKPMATGPGSWVYELSAPGDVHLRDAQRFELSGKDKKALAAYRRAMTYFDAARFPANYTDARRQAYQKHLHAYRKVATLTGFPLELVDVPFEGKTIRTHFHSRDAASDQRQAVLVWSGGLDGWKTGGMDFKQRLMDEGFSVLAIDLPGTGESEWPLEANSERVYSAVIDYLKTRPDVDANRIAVYFGSFSGVFAIKLALTNPGLAAAVNHSGGIHLFFNPPMDQIPPLTTTMGMRATATTYAMDVFNASMTAIKTKFATFSLQTQGLLKPTPTQAPLLSIYGTADRLMPIQDLDVLMASGVQSTNLVYEGDRHMAWEHESDHRSKMIAWLKEQLRMEQSGL